MRLASSCTVGSRQPTRPPVSRLLQRKWAWNQLVVDVLGDCSHTRPVSLSRTAAFPKGWKDYRTLWAEFVRLTVPTTGNR